MNSNKTISDPFDKTYLNIQAIVEKSRTQIYRQINFTIVKAYWEIGRIIVEEEQKGIGKAEYGKSLIKDLSIRLSKKFGEGFSERNLWYFRSFFNKFPKMNALRSELSWTHYRIILRLENDNACNFYLMETINNKWSTRELERQINSLLYERLALSKNKKELLIMSKKGQLIEKPIDLIKDPFVLEFLGLKEHPSYTENMLEQKIIENLKNFLLELGKGFMYVDRQKRITLENEHYYIDLVFYNRLLKCFVLIELKIGKLSHKDLGQLQMYVNYFNREVKNTDENNTIGILLCSDKNEAVVKYTLPENNTQIFASKYKLYLPTEEELKAEILKENKYLKT